MPTLATAPSFLGAFFLVTPVGLAPLASVLGTAFFLGAALRVMVGAVSTTGTTRGLELPVCDRVARAMSAMLLGTKGLRKWVSMQSIWRCGQSARGGDC